ncbi:conserved hypothetical protein [Ricinus communis]|uniref:Uncharacterized protein n=1 Tax=Ricinus communis TaxID=3988 RepID=B9SFQ1_RICCO|nr:conserved hypothetical protein [Ricinus communis]
MTSACVDDIQTCAIANMKFIKLNEWLGLMKRAKFGSDMTCGEEADWLGGGH